ncbi:hypothetical protein ACFQMF_09450 [Halorubrum rutilum]|uniref:Uncharacterized protein n=1 Tax=Halorubrum rutilum TaxID=1364933 RepID=A0ABD6AKL7_9EURY|nr:hypothetical protein [Halorubrum rutilum]
MRRDADESVTARSRPRPRHETGPYPVLSGEARPIDGERVADAVGRDS